MNYTLRLAKRENTKPLIGIYSLSGCGKTWSSLLLARGFVGPRGKIGMIETEAGRGEAYAGVAPVGEYFVCSVQEPFSPQEYGKAIAVCEQEKLDALILDSASHEWEAVGGVLDMAAENEAKGWKGQIVWTRPKMEHSRQFTLRLSQTPIPLVIVCMRAKYPLVEFLDDKGKKNMKRSETPSPKQSEDILYEMFIHGWIDQEHKMRVTKYPKAIPELRDVVRDGEPITIESGQRLAQWAAGSPKPATAASTRMTEASHSIEASGTLAAADPMAAAEEMARSATGGMAQAGPESRSVIDAPHEGRGGESAGSIPAAAATQYLSPDQQIMITDECRKLGPDVLGRLLLRARVEHIAKMPASKYESCKEFIATIASKEKK